MQNDREWMNEWCDPRSMPISEDRVDVITVPAGATMIQVWFDASSNPNHWIGKYSDIINKFSLRRNISVQRQ